ncbi:MAG: ankyrin repeat domain-containing protein [Candidatus Micrarchaeia archaeon]
MQKFHKRNCERKKSRLPNLEPKVEQAVGNTRQKDLDAILLRAAAENNYEKVVKAVLAGANINAQDEDGNTPLMHAASNLREDIARFLLENGADINIKNKYNNTALKIAKGFCSRKVIALIKMYKKSASNKAANLKKNECKNTKTEGFLEPT